MNDKEQRLGAVPVYWQRGWMSAFLSRGDR